MNTPFKKSSLSEMCKQIVSAPVIFKKKDGTECLAFYNNEDSIQANKLYILFPGSITPKYIEDNDLYNLRENIIHGISDTQAIALYNKVCTNHKPETVSFINSLIAKAHRNSLIHTVNTVSHRKYNKKHACALVLYKGHIHNCYVKDLLDHSALEVIIENHIEYNVKFDCVIWAAGISAKEFTLLKVELKAIQNA